MILKRKRLLSVTLNLLFLCGLLNAQPTESGTHSLSVVSTDSIAINMYRRFMVNENKLVNGKQYIPYQHSYKSNPFYKSTMGKGIIYYRERTFTDKIIIYDMFKDELVLNYHNPEGVLKLISLNEQFVDSFLIIINNTSTMFHTLHFNDKSKMDDGYYEVPVKGKTSLLIKHRMELELKDGYDYYDYLPIKYLYINNKYCKITTLPNFLALFGEKKPAMKKFIRSIHLWSFREITISHFAQILKYYDTL